MKKRIRAVWTGMSGISDISLRILAISAAFISALIAMSYIFRLYYSVHGGLAERMTDIAGLLDITPALAFVAVLSAAVFDLAERKAGG
ncbi:MAG: hypothetical protein IKS19_01435 [Clostridia bacterium]|nr:hypothetical protein [Clostridia bacterium]